MNTFTSNCRSNSIVLGSGELAETSQTAQARAEKITKKGTGKGRTILLATVTAVATLLGTSAARTANASIQLTDQNSSVMINPSSSAGLENWTVDGVNQLNQEWFWYNVGSSGGQSSIDSLGLTNTALFDTTGGPNNDTAELSYGSAGGLQVTVTYSLSGGKTGSHASDLGETISFENGGSSTNTYHLFEYANFNLDDSTSGQSVTLSGSNTAVDQGNGTISQVIVAPKPGQFDANTFPNLLDTIDSTSSTLSALPDAATSGTGDGEWAFEWDLTLAPGASYVESTDQQITPQIPEPSGALIVLGIGGVFLIRPRRRNRNPDRKGLQFAERLLQLS